MKMIFALMMTVSSMFMFMNHPLTLGLLIILQTILTSISVGMINFSFWFSYILFLVMIGGMLILFIYMTSVASNEKFKFSNKLIIFSMLIFCLSHLAIKQNFLKTMDMLLFFNDMNEFSLNKYFNFPFNLTSIFLMIYLLLTLIVVVKITKKNFGPIRQFK